MSRELKKKGKKGEHGPIEVVSIHEDVKGDELAQKRVLVLPHGGPHGYFVEEFQPMFLFFALQGYVVLLGTICPTCSSIDACTH